MAELKRHTEYTPGFDKRDENPDYGINGGCFIFVVSGPLGAVDFMFTPSFFPEKTKEWLIHCSHGDPTKLISSYEPLAYTVGYHSPKPVYEDHGIYTKDCAYVEGGKCYTDCNYSLAGEFLKGFLSDGTDWLWKKLEEHYNETFKT